MKRTHSEMSRLEKPKKPVNSFVLFMQHEKAAGGASSTRKELQLRWGEMNAETKKVYDLEYAKHYLVWQRQMADYIEQNPDDSDDEEEEKEKVPKAKKPKKVKDPNAPAKYKPAYFLYQSAMRTKLKEEKPELKGKEIQTRISEMWKVESDDTKKVYFDQEAKAKKIYEAKLAVYKAEKAAAGDDGDVAPAKEKKAKKEKAKEVKATPEKAKKEKAKEKKAKKEKKDSKPKPQIIEQESESEDESESSDEINEESDDEDLLNASDSVGESSSEEVEDDDSDDENDDEDDSDSDDEGVSISFK